MVVTECAITVSKTTTPQKKKSPVLQKLLLTFWSSNVGPFLVEVPKGEPFSSGSFGQLRKCLEKPRASNHNARVKRAKAKRRPRGAAALRRPEPRSGAGPVKGRRPGTGTRQWALLKGVHPPTFDSFEHQPTSFFAQRRFTCSM